MLASPYSGEPNSGLVRYRSVFATDLFLVQTLLKRKITYVK